MADQATNLTTTATGSGLSGVTGMLQGSINNLTSTGQSLLDRFFPPETRETVKQKLTAFATERPKLAAFLLSQIALSGLPLALFFIMTLTVVVFALLTGILVGVVGALVFIVLAVGAALFVLLPTLFITTFSAVAVWLWAVGAYYIVKWFNEKSIPGIHVPLAGGFLDQTGLGDLPLFKGLTGGETNGTARESNGTARGTAVDDEKDGEGRHRNGAAVKTEHHADGKENGPVQTKSPQHKKKREKTEDKTVTKIPTKSVAGATDGVADVGKGVTGVVS